MLPATASSTGRNPFLAAAGVLLHHHHHHVEYYSGMPRSVAASSAVGCHAKNGQQLIISSSAKCSLPLAPHKMFGASPSTHRMHSSSRTSDVAVRTAGVDPATVADAVVSLPFGFDLPHDSQWQLWLLGAVASFVIPLATGKLGLLGKLFDKFDEAVEMAEGVAEMVDKVAEEVEEMADDIGNSLPAGALKDALEYVENLADQTEKAAEYADDLLQKVEEAGDQVEAFAESAIAKEPSSSSSSVMASQEVKAEI